MYKLEITTNDTRETLIFEEYIDTWQELKESIDYFKKLKLQNIYIKAYKEKGQEELDYLGEFSQLETIQRDQTKTRKVKASNIIIILEILLFPIMILKEMTKGQ